MLKKKLALGLLFLVLVTGTLGQDGNDQGSDGAVAVTSNDSLEGNGSSLAESSKESTTGTTENQSADATTQSSPTKTNPVGAPQNTENQKAEATPGEQQNVEENVSQDTDPTRTAGNAGGATTGGNIAKQGKRDVDEEDNGEQYSSDIVKSDETVLLNWSGDLNPAGACKVDKTTYCPDLQFGEQVVLKCLTMQLVRHWDGADGAITARCLEEMVNYKIHHTQSINGDIELAKACSKDAETHCKNPKRYQASAQGGAVVACLRTKRDELAPVCQQEIFRVMREAAYDFRLDAALNEKCKDEVEKHCHGIFPGEGRVVECLHTVAFDKMKNEDDCKKEVVRQLRETSADIRLNHQLFQACNFEMQQFCRGIQPAEERMQICLADSRDEEGFGAKCKESVLHLLQHHIEDVQEDEVLLEGCIEDLKQYCNFDENEESPDGGEMLACLANNKDKLHESCVGEVSRLLKEQFRNIDLNPKLLQECGTDIDKHCQNTVKDEGLTVECLVENRDELTESCGKLLFEQRIIRNQSIAYNMVVKKACAKDTQMFCDKVDPGEGRVLQCLMENFDDEDMSMNCKKALSGLAKDEAEDYRLDPQLQKACKDDAITLCKGVCDPEDNTQSCDGKVIACLEYHTLQEEDARMDVGAHDEDPVNPDSEVSEDCQRALSFRTRMQASDFRVNEVLADSCHEDAQKFCINRTPNPVKPGDGRIFDCLFEHFPKLNETCQEEELKFKIVQSESVNRLPYLFKACQMETAYFCTKVTPTGGDVLKCLETNVQSSPDEFKADCKQALISRTKNVQKDYRFDQGLHKHCKRVAKKYNCPKIKPKNIANGKIFLCLVDHFDSLLEDPEDSKCAGEMSRVVRQLFFHYKEGAPVTKVCDDDLKKICENMEPKAERHSGRTTQCLMKYLRDDKPMPTEECNRLVMVGQPHKPSHAGQEDSAANAAREKMLKDQIESSKAQQKQIQENLVSLTNQLKQAQANNAVITKENEMDKNTLIGIVALFGFALLAAIVGAVWAVRKYLSKGYMVLKSGDV